MEATKEAAEAKKRGERTVKVIYCHEIAGIAKKTSCHSWTIGEIKEVSLREAEILLKNHKFLIKNLNLPGAGFFIDIY